MSSTKKVLIFGASGVGKKVKEKLEKKGAIVVAFSDNNQDIWGSHFCGLPVISPKEMQIDAYDLYAVGSFKGKEAIKRQLLDLGVEEERIEVPIEAPIISYNNSIDFSIPDDNESLIFVLGGINANDHNSTQMQQNGPKIRTWDFGNCFWGFQYFIEDCLSVEYGEEYAKSFWQENRVTNYVELIIDVIDLRKHFDELCVAQKNSGHYLYFHKNVIREIVENENTISFWTKRLPRRFDEGLLKRLEELRAVAEKYNFPLAETMVLSGSVLQAYGLRDEQYRDDLDIIMTERFRALYGRKLVVVSDHIEMHPENEFTECREELTDDKMIENHTYHFYLRGIKFLTAETAYLRSELVSSVETRLLRWGVVDGA